MTRIALLIFSYVASQLVLTSFASAQVKLKANRTQQPIAIDSFDKIDGFVGERIRANVVNYIKTFDIERHVQAVEYRKHRDWSWVVGEQPGKWLESVALNSAWMNDDQLRQQAETMLTRIIKSQEPSGYVGVTDPEVRTSEKPLRGMDAYELYFMFHGLLTAAEEWKSESAFNAAKKLGDYFVATIGPDKAGFWPSLLRDPENKRKYCSGQSAIAGHAVHYSWEGTLLIDPMLRLYEQTGDRKYLDWSRWTIENIDKWSGWDAFLNLEKVADGEMGVHQLQPYVHSHTFQMNFLGFLRMYQLTGDESYMRKVKGAWDDIARRQMYVTGGVSVGEHYEKGYIKPIKGHVVETCATMSWMQLTQYLLELTGDPKYADATERLLLNHVFAAQSIDGDCIRYHTPPNGAKNDYFHGPDCCTGSGHRIISLLPLFIYTTDAQGLIVNQYIPGKANITLTKNQKVEIEQDTTYPESEKITLRITPDFAGDTTFKFRIPSWTDNAKVDVPAGWKLTFHDSSRKNSKELHSPQQGAPCYAVVVGACSKSKTLSFTLTFPMKTRWIKRPHHVEDRIVRLQGGGSEQMREEVKVKFSPYGLMRGPVVYAYDTAWQTSKKTIPPEMLAYNPDKPAPLRQVDAPERAMGPGLATQLFSVDGKKLDVLMLPFANIGRWFRTEEEKQKVRNTKAYPYAIWLADTNNEKFKKRIAPVEKLTR